MGDEITKEQIIKQLNLDLSNNIDTLEKLLCACLLQEGISITASVTNRILKYKKILDLDITWNC